MNQLLKEKIAIIGMGYVGLPLAIEFGKKQKTCGFDINEERISQLKNHDDVTKEVTKGEFLEASKLSFSSRETDIQDHSIYIVTVPTPIDKQKKPDLYPLETACICIAKNLNKGNLVIFESTVFPGATEEFCVPILEKNSNLKFNQDFYCGYSPERINPGKNSEKVRDIVKITSGSTPEIALKVNQLYSNIIDAGTHMASSIKIAEAAKVIENTQRDINIALVNELSMLFNEMDINTTEVLEAASTKWNFHKYTPGLVGGHCIGVDPFYLTYKAQQIGFEPNLILAGRHINDAMPDYLCDVLSKQFKKSGKKLKNSKILLMGVTFKENCPDIRNSKSLDLLKILHDKGCHVDISDPNANENEVMKLAGIQLKKEVLNNEYDAIILAVAHDEYKELGLDAIKNLGKEDCVIYDVKNIFKDKKLLKL